MKWASGNMCSSDSVVISKNSVSFRQHEGGEYLKIVCNLNKFFFVIILIFLDFCLDNWLIAKKYFVG